MTARTTAQTLVGGAVAGAKAGAMASLPMGASMHVGRLATQTPSRAAFSAVTRALETKLGVELAEKPHAVAAWAGHVGYGAAAGAVFGAATSLLPQQARTTGASTVLGALFGVAVWAVSYAGWLPKARVLPAAKHSSTAFNAVNIGSHVLWGAGVGAAVGRAATAASNDVIDMKAGA